MALAPSECKSQITGQDNSGRLIVTEPFSRRACGHSHSQTHGESDRFKPDVTSLRLRLPHNHTTWERSAPVRNKLAVFTIVIFHVPVHSYPPLLRLTVLCLFFSECTVGYFYPPSRAVRHRVHVCLLISLVVCSFFESHSELFNCPIRPFMTAKTQTIPAFPRFSRFNLGLTVKSHSVSPRPSRRAHEKRPSEGSEDWYIPYNGPYEKPKDPPPKLHPRDSWGDLIQPDEVEAVLADKDLHVRYGGDKEDRTDDSPGGSRHRALSGVSHQTVSSTAIDPYRISGSASRRRSTVSHPNSRHHTLSTYINPDTAGDVGASPTPLQRLAPPPQSPKGAFSNLFAFAGPSKKIPQSKLVHEKSSDKRSSGGTSSPLLRKSVSSEGRQNGVMSRNRRELRGISDNGSPPVTDEDDYHSPYYSIRRPRRDEPSRMPFSFEKDPSAPVASTSQHQLPSRPNPPAPSSNPDPESSSSSHITRHPYAYVFPSDALGIPNTFTKQDPGPIHQRILLTGPKRSNAAGSPTPIADPAKSHLRRLKTSVSSPNLRTGSEPQSTKPKPSKLRDRWFAVETWCDAILFPRPRFKIREDGQSNMIVSPLASPVVPVPENDESSGSQRRQVPGVQSRVLAHSKSVAELGERSPEAGPSRRVLRRRSATMPSKPIPPLPPLKMPTKDAVRRSFAQDDLALPSPEPSLIKVLEDGQRLDEMRKKWQSQATDSFQNKRTRQLSRTRSKSLTSGHPRPRRKEGEGNKVMDSIDFLAERTFLGSQATMPAISAPKSTHKSSDKSVTATVSSRSHSHSGSHSHSNSVTKSSSKASGQRGHSRNESWGQSARKMAASLCGLNGDAALLASDDEQSSAMDGVLKGDTTKVIVLIDPAAAMSPVSPSDPLTAEPKPTLLFGIDRVSPVPSASTADGVAVGIALSTPPPDNARYDNEPIHFPDHPYAQAYPSTTATSIAPLPPPESIRGSDYAGPHPTSSHMISIDLPSDANSFSNRHRLPPQVTLHPYAQALSPDSYQGIVPQLRSDSDVPAPAKMWARLSADRVREILPSEIQYSPYSPDHQMETENGEDGQRTHDRVSVGEALTHAMRCEPRDSGIGTSEEQEVPAIHLEAPVGGKRSREEDRNNDHDGQTDFIVHPAPRTAMGPTSLQMVPSAAGLASPEAEHVQSSGSSPGLHSQSSSPQVSPRPLGSDDDLDTFRDLFYKPNAARMSPIEMMPPPVSPASGNSLVWEIASRRTGSGLTSLARQLSEELDELNAQMDYAGGDSPTMSLGRYQASLRFVLTDGQEIASSSLGDTSPLRVGHAKSVFQPGDNIPEDVESSRASSILENAQLDEGTTEITRVGLVSPIITPPATVNDHRLSGHLSLVDEDVGADEGTATVRLRVKSGTSASLQTPSAAGLTRSSYMTTSTSASRMSGLSDFPIPPDIGNDMKLFDSFFNDSARASIDHSSDPEPQAPVSRRMTFGGDEDIEDIAKSLSAP